jgi:hypothetical protein
MDNLLCPQLTVINLMMNGDEYGMLVGRLWELPKCTFKAALHRVYCHTVVVTCAPKIPSQVESKLSSVIPMITNFVHFYFRLWTAIHVNSATPCMEMYNL